MRWLLIILALLPTMLWGQTSPALNTLTGPYRGPLSWVTPKTLKDSIDVLEARLLAAISDSTGLAFDSVYTLSAALIDVRNRYLADSTAKANLINTLDSRVDADSARLDSLRLASARQDDSLAVRMQRAARDSAEAYADDAVDAAREIVADSLAADTLRYFWLRILPADSSASGTAEPGIAGETVTFGQSVYFKSDGKWWLTDADTVITMPSMGVVVTKGSTAANGAITVLKSGYVRCDAWNWTVGNGAGMIYPSTTPGGWTQTAVSGTSDNLQFAGYARTADIIYYWPCYLMVQIK